MPLRLKRNIAEVMEQEILRRYDMRGIARELVDGDRKRLRKIADKVEALAPYWPVAATRAFLDHAFPVGNKSFRPMRSLVHEWTTWAGEIYPTIAHLFPITPEDEEIVECFFRDWRALRENRGYYRTVFYRPADVGGARLLAAYRFTHDFYRVMTVLRHYQQDAQMSRYPLFTLRAFLASQFEALSGFVPRFQIGNVVSTKARDRFDEWYLYRFYQLELVKKGLKRPSDNNPVSNLGIRVEYEDQRAGSGVGDLTFENEVPVPWMTRPARSFGGGVVIEDLEKQIRLPPGMGDLLHER